MVGSIRRLTSAPRSGVGCAEGDVCVECEPGVEGEFVASGAGGDAGDGGGKPAVGRRARGSRWPRSPGRLSGVPAGR